MDLPTPFTADDFAPLDTFALRWRWTKPSHNVLPPDDLATIRPFTEPVAQELWEHAGKFLKPFKTATRWDLSETVFASIHRMDTDGDDSDVDRWLQQRGVPAATHVVVFWESGLAVLCRWDVFCRYWDDFCYPSSDDVIIWPFSQQWALAYWHEKQFVFGTKAESEDAGKSPSD